MVSLLKTLGYIAWIEYDSNNKISMILIAHPDAIEFYKMWHKLVMIDPTFNCCMYEGQCMDVVGRTPFNLSFIICQVLFCQYNLNLL